MNIKEEIDNRIEKENNERLFLVRLVQRNLKKYWWKYTWVEFSKITWISAPSISRIAMNIEVMSAKQVNKYIEIIENIKFTYLK